LKENIQRGFIVVEGRIILKWIVNQYGVRIWTEFIRLRILFSTGFFSAL
jgi:hypothetical protein